MGPEITTTPRGSLLVRPVGPAGALPEVPSTVTRAGDSLVRTPSQRRRAVKAAIHFSIWRATGQFFGGIGHQARDLGRTIIRHPLASLAIVGAGSAVVMAAPLVGLTSAAVGTALGVAFGATGAWKMGIGGMRAIGNLRAGQMAQAEASFEAIGRGTFDVALVVGPAVAGKAIGILAKTEAGAATLAVAKQTRWVQAVGGLVETPSAWTRQALQFVRRSALGQLVSRAGQSETLAAIAQSRAIRGFNFTFDTLPGRWSAAAESWAVAGIDASVAGRTVAGWARGQGLAAFARGRLEPVSFSVWGDMSARVRDRLPEFRRQMLGAEDAVRAAEQQQSIRTMVLQQMYGQLQEAKLLGPKIGRGHEKVFARWVEAGGSPTTRKLLAVVDAETARYTAYSRLGEMGLGASEANLTALEATELTARMRPVIQARLREMAPGTPHAELGEQALVDAMSQLNADLDLARPGHNGPAKMDRLVVAFQQRFEARRQVLVNAATHQQPAPALAPPATLGERGFKALLEDARDSHRLAKSQIGLYERLAMASPHDADLVVAELRRVIAAPAESPDAFLALGPTGKLSAAARQAGMAELEIARVSCASTLHAAVQSARAGFARGALTEADLRFLERLTVTSDLDTTALTGLEASLRQVAQGAHEQGPQALDTVLGPLKRRFPAQAPAVSAGAPIAAWKGLDRQALAEILEAPLKEAVGRYRYQPEVLEACIDELLAGGPLSDISGIRGFKDITLHSSDQARLNWTLASRLATENGLAEVLPASVFETILKSSEVTEAHFGIPFTAEEIAAAMPMLRQTPPQLWLTDTVLVANQSKYGLSEIELDAGVLHQIASHVADHLKVFVHPAFRALRDMQLQRNFTRSGRPLN